MQFEHLSKFCRDEKVTSKGKLCLVLVVTQSAKSLSFPLQETDFITEKEGQVKGLGKSAVQAILSDYGITKVLAEEGGRTSRGSMGLMKSYLSFLNSNVTSSDDLIAFESWWIERVGEFFSAKPFKFHVDNSKTISNAIYHLIKQAENRQAENVGTTYVGALYQHLVGAKLAVALSDVEIESHGYSVSDDSTARNGDFHIGDSVIHVTTFPQEALVRKCSRNIQDSKRPIIVTSQRGFAVADSLLENATIRDRVDVYEISQFLSINVNELSRFKSENNRSTISAIMRKYNEIVETVETDPSLRVDFE